jgi:hypothetical protein
MSLQGQIKEFGLTEIFQLIQIQKREGALRLRQGRAEAMVLFENGSIVLAKSGTEDEWISITDFLIRGKRLTTDQLQEAMKGMKKKGETELGPFLVRKGTVSREDLQAVVKLYIQETLFKLFTWKSGDYQFDARTVSYNKDYFAPLNLEFILMEGMRRLDEWPQLQRKIPVKGMVFEKTDKELPAQEEDAGQGVEFSIEGEDNTDGEKNRKPESEIGPEERLLYQMVDGEKSVSLLADNSMLGEFPAYKALATLSDSGYIQPVIKNRKPLVLAQTAPQEKSDATGQDGRAKLIAVWVTNGVILVLLVTLIFLSARTINFEDPLSMSALQPFHYLAAGEKTDRIQYALHLYHIRYNHFPEKLELLVEDADLSPTDLFDPWGQLWQYRLTPEGFSLSSIGEPLAIK